MRSSTYHNKHTILKTVDRQYVKTQDNNFFYTQKSFWSSVPAMVAATMLFVPTQCGCEEKQTVEEEHEHTA